MSMNSAAAWRMNPRISIAAAHDVTVAALAWAAAYGLRFNFEWPPGTAAIVLGNLFFVVPLQAIIFYFSGLYRGMWRFASIPDLRRIVLSAGVSLLAVPSFLYMVQRLHEVPRSVLILDPILLVLMMGGSRFLYRAWRDGQLLTPRQLNAEPVLVIGAGTVAATLLREIGGSEKWRVVGLIDDAPGQIGRQISGVPVVGLLEQLPDLAMKNQVRTAIVAMPNADSALRRRAIEVASGAGLSVLTVPTMDDVLAGKLSVSQVRKVELEDLLGREPVQLDSAGIQRLIAGKTILVTGAGGSIGSELCRQIIRFGPDRLVFFELSEFALYSIEQEFHDMPVICRVGDVKDSAQLEAVFAEFHPDVVFHAAAYKHVPLMEMANAWQAVLNNVLGTWQVAKVAESFGTREFVLISTDKAVNPTNVMGASKRLAERVCAALQPRSNSIRYVMVRFGNVLGSSGSVIPKFREQIAKGGPVTVTHPEIVRFFMLIPEAAQLVLQAALMASNDAVAGEIFVLDMGEPVNIADLARDMIRLSGFTEDEIRIEFTGLRPGEKLYEELLADGETTLPTPHPKLRVMKAEQAPDAAWLAELEAWLAAPVRSEAEVKEGLRRWVPEYRPAQH